MPETMELIFATRPSALARWQTEWVMDQLRQAWPGLACEAEVITTRGDRILDRPLPEIGGKGLFTEELEAVLHDGQVNGAVHSLKDLPIEIPEGLTLGAVPERAEVRDALVSARGYTLDTLPQGALVGTSSLRRKAQVLLYRPDLRVEPIRGNVDTRVRKALEEQYDAVVLAGAGLIRLGLEEQISQWLPLEVMLPAPGQGALAVQCRAEDQETLHYLAALEDAKTRLATRTERAFLNGLGGGCSLPVAAHAVLHDGEIELLGLVVSPGGEKAVTVQRTGREPEALGAQAAHEALEAGAGAYLHV